MRHLKCAFEKKIKKIKAKYDATKLREAGNLSNAKCEARRWSQESGRDEEGEKAQNRGGGGGGGGNRLKMNMEAEKENEK